MAWRGDGAMAQKPKLGFIGIGIMGEAMVLRLLDQGFAVTVWNLTPDRYATVVPAGARHAAAPPAGPAATRHRQIFDPHSAPVAHWCLRRELHGAALTAR